MDFFLKFSEHSYKFLLPSSGPEVAFVDHLGFSPYSFSLSVRPFRFFSLFLFSEREAVVLFLEITLFTLVTIYLAPIVSSALSILMFCVFF